MRVYLAQLTHEKNGVFQNHCFPLAIGFIGSFLKKEFGEQVEIELFKSVDDLNAAFMKAAPDVLMLSSYMWNYNFTLAYAEEARLKYKDLLIIVGGPHISLDPSERQRFLREYPAIDAYVLFEGERAAREIVAVFLNTKSRDEVKKLALTQKSIIALQPEGDVVPTLGEVDRTSRIGLKGSSLSLDDIPSPYLNGMFDKFFKDAEIPLIETNRGCPFTCTFCQQGGEYYTKVVHFDVTRVREEIMYIADKIYKDKIDAYVLEVADPNFGMFERDRDICAAIREAQDKTGYPKYVGCSTGKNKADVIIENTSLLELGTIQLRSAMQSLHTETLDAIKRKNIKVDAYYQIQKDMDIKGLENNTDIMLGLPLETKISHFKGIFDLIDAGIREFSCVQTIVLPGIEMELKSYKEQYGIKTKYRFIPEGLGKYDMIGKERSVGEIEEIIIQTNTMSYEDYFECRKLHLLLMIFHNTRLLSTVYKYMEDLNINKSEIVRRICDYYPKNPMLKALLEDFKKDTESELFNHYSDIDFDNPHNEDVSYNKIFKHLSIVWFDHKDLILEVLTTVLLDILGPENTSEIEELVHMIKVGMVNPFEKLERQIIPIKSDKLQRVLSSQLEYYPSDRQLTTIRVINNLYKTPEDRINKMVYKLRPVNLMLKITMPETVKISKSTATEASEAAY